MHFRGRRHHFVSWPRFPATQPPPAIKGAPKGTQPLVPSIFPRLPGIGSGQLWRKVGTKRGATGLPHTAKVPKSSLVQRMSRCAGLGEVYSHKAGNALRLPCCRERCQGDWFRGRELTSQKCRGSRGMGQEIGPTL